MLSRSLPRAWALQPDSDPPQLGSLALALTQSFQSSWLSERRRELSAAGSAFSAAGSLPWCTVVLTVIADFADDNSIQMLLYNPTYNPSKMDRCNPTIYNDGKIATLGPFP